MLIRCVVVGINHWFDLTKPFLDGLIEHNDGLNIIAVDNYSNDPYPMDQGSPYTIQRTPARYGYGAALNYGAYGGAWDWLLCCNNDCICEGNITDAIARLRIDTIYGNAWKLDYSGMKNGLPSVVDSAYFLINKSVWGTIGGFDPDMDAAFEEIDYQIRAMDAGYRVDVAELDIIHLSQHTRWELPDYGQRWSVSEAAFQKKHPARKEEK